MKLSSYCIVLLNLFILLIAILDGIEFDKYLGIWIPGMITGVYLMNFILKD